MRKIKAEQARIKERKEKNEKETMDKISDKQRQLEEIMGKKSTLKERHSKQDRVIIGS